MCLVHGVLTSESGGERFVEGFRVLMELGGSLVIYWFCLIFLILVPPILVVQKLLLCH